MVYNWNIANLRQAIDMATKVAAESVGIEDECGILKEGRDADFIVLTEDLELERTYLDGELKYEK